MAGYFSVWRSQPPRCVSDCGGRGGERGGTLTRDLDAVVDANGLTVVGVFSGAFAEPGVVEVLEVRHLSRACQAGVVFESICRLCESRIFE